MSNNIIQSYYKRNDLNHIEELIMRVTNYAWSEMTLLQQGELRENAAAELAAMQARIEKLETENTRLNKIIHAVDVASRRRLKSGETVYNIISAVQDALESA